MFDGVMVRLRGGLGNQMFQYAAARSLAVKLDAPLWIDPSALGGTGPMDTPRRLQLDRFAIDAKIADARTIADPSVKDIYEAAFHFDPALRTIERGVRANGYFQSELYFAGHAELIRKEFTLLDRPSPARQAIRQAIADAPFAVAIHVRDYGQEGAVTASHHGMCPPSYYERARRLIEGIGGTDVRYFIFTDNPEAAARRLGPLENAEVMSGGEELPWEDLHLMAACRAHIIANSSFSWWGAWLAAQDEPLVIAPRRWFGRGTLQPANTLDLFPESWITA